MSGADRPGPLFTPDQRRALGQLAAAALFVFALGFALGVMVW